MPTALVPLFCEQCDAILPSGLNVSVSGKGARVTFRNCASTCPRCGSVARVLDGVYSALSDTAIAFTSGNVPPDRFQQLVNILDSARHRKADTREVGGQIRRVVPELSSVADVLPTTRNELYAFIAILLSFAGLLLATYATSKEAKPAPVAEAKIQELIDKTLEKAYSLSPEAPESKSRQD